jgi:hypothetical protein
MLSVSLVKLSSLRVKDHLNAEAAEAHAEFAEFGTLVRQNAA